jgi:hypothetical protein
VAWVGLLAGCAAPPAALSPTPASLQIEILYPTPDTVLEMGDSLHVLAAVTNAEGQPVTDALLNIAVSDSTGDQAVELEAAADAQGTYRAPAWPVPHRVRPGEWRLELEADSSGAAGQAASTFEVQPSTSEVLLERYGFWVDAPDIVAADPSLAGEFGDAANGRLLWGAVVPAAHIMPSAWLEIQWRQGSPPLATAGDVRRFFLEDLGRFGFSRTRALGPITPLRFQNWAAWHVAARGEFQHEQVEWVVFYAPEVDRTFAIGTTFVLPPPGIDAAAQVRRSFRVAPEESADGVAPAPLPDLLPPPELGAPALGTQFIGTRDPVRLSWTWFRPLEQDEAYLVRLDYNYQEANQSQSFRTRETQLTLPRSLYDSPNCRVFNWQVSVVRPEAEDQAVSYESLYAYLLWTYPPDQAPPFLPLCPNEQY